VLLVLLFAGLWLAGGASRADALGQVVVRAYAWGSLVIFGLFAARPQFGDMRPVLVILLSALCLVMVQLVPLPPEVWRALPGRSVLVEAAVGQAQPWRPWTMTPAATVNALSSLVVPLVTMILAAGLQRSERSWLLALLLAVVVASAFIGLLQVSGVIINNPFINDTIGEVSGTLANRNHFAVLLAIGCPLATSWALDGQPGHTRYRLPAALGLVVLLLLTILASGSRAGMLTGLIGCLGAFLLVRDRIWRRFRNAPRWLLPAIVAGTLFLIVALIGFSIAADRAVSINRIFNVDVGDDMRSRGLPTVLAMIQTYLPFGSGLGGFDPVFRMHEPFFLLKPTYFNHAHNDYLEVALDAGVPGLTLLGGALVWWGRASIAAWTAPAGNSHKTRLGSLILAIIMVASVFDYPVRTPIMMAVLVIAALWLSGFDPENRGSALPETANHL
jgi:O-antigen ligase